MSAATANPDTVNMYWLVESYRKKLTADYGLSGEMMSCPAVDQNPSAIYGNSLGEGKWVAGGAKSHIGLKLNATSYAVWAGHTAGYRKSTSTFGLTPAELPLRDTDEKVMKSGQTLIPWASCYQVYSGVTKTWVEPGTLTHSVSLHHDTGMSAVNPDGSTIFKNYPGRLITDYNGDPDVLKVTKNLGGSLDFYLAY
jgi:hypothetical protein